MNKTDRQLESEIYDLKQRLRNMVQMNAEQQAKIRELESSLGRVFSETVQHAR